MGLDQNTDKGLLNMCLSSIYNASRDVHNCVAATEEMSTVIQKLQTRHGVQVDIPFVMNSLRI